MTFPTGTISADDIRHELAYNNTAGAQTPVTLNDLPVRCAADKLSGTVSYNDLRGKNVFFSGTITWGYLFSFPNQIYGYTPYYGGVGSLSNTTSYFRKPSIDSDPTPQAAFQIVDIYNGLDDTEITTISITSGSSLYPAPSSVYLTVYIDGVKYALTADNYYAGGWHFQYAMGNGDPLGLAGRNGQTSTVVITY